jgi:uncharacterized protein (DUF1800 family)
MPRPTTSAQDAPALTERERAAHVLSRLGFGPRPGDIDRMLETGVDAWIDDQLQAKEAQDPRLLSRLADFETVDLGVKDCVAFTRGIPLDRSAPREEQRSARELQRQPARELKQAVAVRALFSERVAEEVLADFFRNHFNVSFTKGMRIFAQVPDYERSVVRGHLWGKFPDMLLASAQHPAMLTYLDNYLSRRPPSKQELKEIERRTKRQTGSEERAEEAVSIAQQRGLNENYGRELLELHTVGVDNGYDQGDVITAAEVLTGWTIDGGRTGTQEFLFRPEMHLKGDKRLFGKRLREDKDDGPGQGVDMIRMLAEDKRTAGFIAMKLVRYLVADRPPQRLVDEVAKVYRKTDGDIPAMVRKVVDSDEFWDRAHIRSKFKRPYEFVVSALRVTGAEIENLAALENYLNGMGEPIYMCDDPTGYYDTADAWLDPGVMALRWEFATDLAEGRVRGVAIPDTFYAQVPEDVPARLWQHYLTELILPGGAGARTRAALATVTTEYLDRKKVPDLFEFGPTLVGLLLGSPEFQQQ